MSNFAVLLEGQTTPRLYGPFATASEAEEFAAFLTAEVDPAKVVPLRNPVGELLAWWRYKTDRNEDVPW